MFRDLSERSSPRQRRLATFWKAVRPFVARFFAGAGIVTLVVVGSVLCAVFPPPLVSTAGYTYHDATFNWAWNPRLATDPPALPFNRSFDNFTVLFDSHSHTNFGPFSSSSALTPRQNIEFHLANGFQATAVSEHNNIVAALEAQKIAREEYAGKFVVLVAQEYSCCRAHLNLIGIHTLINATNKYPSNDELREVIRQTHEQGGLVVANHLTWSARTFGTEAPSMKEWIDMGVDFFTVVHIDTLLWTVYQEIQAHHSESVGVVTSTDVHEPNQRVYGWTAMNPANLSEAAVMEELRARRVTPIYDEFGSPNVASPTVFSSYAGWLVYPWYNLGQMLISATTDVEEPMYSFVQGYCGELKVQLRWRAIWVWVAWIFVVWACFETIGAVARLALRRFAVCCCKRGRRDSRMSCCGACTSKKETEEHPLMESRLDSFFDS